MKYKVHRLSVNNQNMAERLELFLNTLTGEVISVYPNVRPSFQFMGATAKIDAVFVVEKTN